MSGSTKQVTVVINGEEYVSTAAKQAEAGITLFGKKIPFVLDATKLLEMGLNAVKAAFGFLKQFAMDSIRAFDDFSASQTKLNAMSKLTGVSMGEMNELVRKAREEFGLSTVASGDLAGSVAKFAAQAGSASKAGDLMASALELGAASGMNAAEVADGLSSALAGNDEWLNRLGLANPSQLWKDYAAANGRAVGTLTDTEQKLAVMTAIMDAGNKVAGTYAERMASGAGAQDRLNNKIDDAKVAFGQAIQPLRVFVVQGLTSIVEVGGRVVLAVARVANAIGVVMTGAIEGARSILGDLAIGLGKLTGSKDIEDWGRRNSTAFSDFRAQLSKLEDKYLTTGKAAEESATKQEGANRKAGASVKTVVETAEAAAERLNNTLEKKLGRPMQVAIGLTAGAIESLARAAVEQLPTAQSERFLTHMQGLVDASAKARDRMLGIGEGSREGAARTKDMAREVEGFARGALDAATAFGVIDDTAARSLNSAINIASAVANIAKSGFSFAGVTGILGGVANIVGTMMSGDTDRRRLLRENNDAIRRLSRDISALKLNVTGEDIEKARGAVTGFQANERSVSPTELQGDIDRLSGVLASRGMTLGEFERIAKELGVNIRNSKGEITAAGINAAIRAIGMVQPGRVGQDFGSQFDFFKQGQRVEGSQGTVGGIGGMLDFLRNVGGVTALNGIDVSDPAAARAALRTLFTQLNNGQGVQGLGRLTGQQFMDIILSIIDSIDSLPSGAASAPTVPTGAIDPATGAPPSTGSAGGEVPAETIQAVIKAMDTRMLTVLSSHTPLFDRIAVATEGTYAELRQMNVKMDDLILVTAGQAEVMDAKLEAMRRLAALERGERPVFG